MHNIYLYILIMAGVSYLIRVLPLTLIRRPITNRFIRSFLFYVPYVTLAVMTFPSIVEATQMLCSAWTGNRSCLPECGTFSGGAQLLCGRVCSGMVFVTGWLHALW